MRQLCRRLDSCRRNGCGRAPRAAAWLLFLSTIAQAGPSAPADRWWSDAAEQALTQAGTNRPELVTALDQTPAAQRDGMQFLVENMPRPDLRSLPAKFLLDHVALIYDAFAKAPWRDRVPADIFLNHVLPSACISETREAWGAGLREKSAPLAAGAASPGHAAQLLNKNILTKILRTMREIKNSKAICPNQEFSAFCRPVWRT
jgi:hypothetical protein